MKSPRYHLGEDPEDGALLIGDVMAREVIARSGRMARRNLLQELVRRANAAPEPSAWVEGLPRESGSYWICREGRVHQAEVTCEGDVVVCRWGGEDLLVTTASGSITHHAPCAVPPPPGPGPMPPGRGSWDAARVAEAGSEGGPS